MIDTPEFERQMMNKKVLCADGFSISIQAGDGLYCTPRIDNAKEYSEVELGLASEKEELLTKYQSGEMFECEIYPYVPVMLVSVVLVKHGGIVRGEVPNGFLKNFLPKDKKS